MLQDAAGSRTVCKKLSSVFFAGYCHADGILSHCNRAVAHKTVKAEAGNVQHVGRLEPHTTAVHRVRFVLRCLVFVIKLSVFITVDRHTIWHQRIERDHFTFAVPNDLRVGVSPQE